MTSGMQARPVPLHDKPPQESKSTASSSDVQRLRLLTYNIQAGIATSGYHHYLTHSWRHVLPCSKRRDNLDQIANLVRHFDIVGLQETDAGSLRSGYINLVEYLANRADFPFWYDQTNRNFGVIAQHSMGILSRFKAAQINEHRLPGTIPGRGALMATYGQSQNPLVLLLVHLALSRRARQRQVGFIADIAREFTNVVVMGDLNCQSDSPEVVRLIERAGLREPAHELHTFPSWRPMRNIDHILVTPSIDVEDVRVLNYPLSDHLPIAMEVVIPAAIGSHSARNSHWDRHFMVEGTP